MSDTGLMSFLCYVIIVGYWSDIIPMLYYHCRLLVLCHSHVILLLSVTGLMPFLCYIIIVGYWSDVIPMLY